VNASKLGFRIRQARERIGMSQEELAAALDKDQRAVSEYENGKRKLAAVEIPNLATILQVPIIHFFTDDEPVYELDDVLLNYFHQLPTAEARHNAIEVLRIFTQAVNRGGQG
jgi:transcriptional regulator with XRE-family HTH domain